MSIESQGSRKRLIQAWTITSRAVERGEQKRGLLRLQGVGRDKEKRESQTAGGAETTHGIDVKQELETFFVHSVLRRALTWTVAVEGLYWSDSSTPYT